MTSDIYAISVDRIDSSPVTLSEYRNKVMLIVNVASGCGFTPQYVGLQRLYSEKRTDGLEVLGFPSNDFMGQEPGTDQEILEFCLHQYDVQFPVFSKITVLGPTKHPLYTRLTSTLPNRVRDGPLLSRLRRNGIQVGDAHEVLWNFEKFLISRTGRVVKRFAPDVTPEDPELIAAIDFELKR